MPREIKLKTFEDQEVSVLVSANQQVQWWHGTAELLALLCRRKAKGIAKSADEHIITKLIERAPRCKTSEPVHLTPAQETMWQEASSASENTAPRNSKS